MAEFHIREGAYPDVQGVPRRGDGFAGTVRMAEATKVDSMDDFPAERRRGHARHLVFARA